MLRPTLYGYIRLLMPPWFLNFSKTSLINVSVLVSSFSIDISASPVSLPSVMVVLVYAFTRLMHENERSQDAVETGKVNASWYNFITRGKAALIGFYARRTSSIVSASGAKCLAVRLWHDSFLPQTASKSVSQLERSHYSVLSDRKFL